MKNEERFFQSPAAAVYSTNFKAETSSCFRHEAHTMSSV